MRVQKQTRHRWSLARLGPGRAAGAAALALLGAVSMALVVWLVVIPATHVQAATYTVNATNDVDDGTCDAHCSLREAINAANASLAVDDVIAIGVTGPIVLTASLSEITDHDLIITGSGEQVSLTAAGSAFKINADRVQINDLVIDGENLGTDGIQISVTSDDLVLNGVTVRGFTGDGFDNAGGGGGKRNTIRNSTFTNNGGNGIDFNGGEENVVRDNLITNNGANGLEMTNEDSFVVQGNTFSGNAIAQMWVGGMQAGQHMSVIQNTITSSSDGIVINNSPAVDVTADIDIGLSVGDRNVFRGSIAPPEQHVRNKSGASINAIFNDWDAYTPAAIEGVICHNGEADCLGSGPVDFEPFIDAPMPLETPTPTATVTPTPTATPEVTATATPGGVQTMPLIAGCNPLAWTGTDDTPVATVADAVTPPEIVDALWVFDIIAGGVWLAYSPWYPAESELTELDRLDVVFICVISPGTFSRPQL